MDLYRYIPSPLRVAEDRFFLPIPFNRVLAVDQDSNYLYRDFDLDNLALCKHSGSKYYCPGQNYYKKRDSSNCLMNLYLNQLKGIADTCTFLPMKASQDFLVQLTVDTFLLYQSEEAQLSVRCSKNFRKSTTISFQGVRKLIIPPGCRARSRSYTFEGEIEISVLDDQLTPQVQQATNLSAFFPQDVITEEIDQVIEELNLVGSEKGVKVRDIATLLRKSREKKIWEFSLGIVGTIVALIVIFLLVYCCCCRGQTCTLPTIRRRSLRRRAGRADSEEARNAPTIEMVPLREPPAPIRKAPGTPHAMRHAPQYHEP